MAREGSSTPTIVAGYGYLRGEQWESTTVFLHVHWLGKPCLVVRLKNNSLKLVTSHFRGLGFSRFHIEEFHDMVCTRESFMPSPLERLAVRPEGKHALLHRDLELERGIEISVEEARGNPYDVHTL